MILSEREWMNEHDSLIQTAAGVKVFPTKQHIFIIEMGCLHDARHPNLSFNVLVSYASLELVVKTQTSLANGVFDIYDLLPDHLQCLA